MQFWLLSVLRGTSRRLPFSLLAVALFATLAHAQWTIVGSFDQNFDCGFFIDPNTGLIGSGNSIDPGEIQNTAVEIFKTTDGGTTWNKVVTPPNSFGAITSIFMKSPNIGYATFFDYPNSGNADIWKTTDGGNTWLQLQADVSGSPTAVYATSKALSVTEWLDHGGSSLDDGKTFSRTFGALPSQTTSNGLDFTDDNTGVATMCQPGATKTPFYFTSDGGVTWNPSSVQPEAWSVYGRKCTSQFFCANEGDAQSPGNTITWSTDGGQTWANRYSFPSTKFNFTGHIAGAGNTLYLQTDTATDQGFFRSDDLGLSWRSVGGPSAHRDTRFVVAGNVGETVFAFDTKGNVWKTSGGGDGTLHSSNSPLSLAADSLQLTAKNCLPDTQQIILTTGTCLDLTIDSISFTPNTLGEFSGNIVTPQIVKSATGAISVIFTPHNSPRHATTLKLFGHSLAGPFDTTIAVTAVNLSVIEPVFGPDEQAFIADTVDVPIYLTQTNDPFTISKLSLTYHFNGDILTPIEIKTTGTLSVNAKTGIDVATTNDNAIIDDTLQTPLTQPTTDFSKPIVIVRFFVTLSRSTTTPITLTGLSIDNGGPLTLCTIPSEQFTAELRCGDSTLKYYLLGNDLSAILSVAPNPSHKARVEVWYNLRSTGNASLDVLDGTGRSVATLSSGTKASGEYHEMFDLIALSSGSYFLRLSIDGVVTGVYHLIRE